MCGGRWSPFLFGKAMLGTGNSVVSGNSGQRRAWVLWLRVSLVTLVLAVIWKSLEPNSGSAIAGSDKLAHGLAYMSVALVGLNNFRALRYKVLFVMFALGLGALMEFGQSFVPGRDMSAADMVANAIGVSIGILLYIPFSLWRRRRRLQVAAA